ncbi:hypothetical protein [Reichenbachiella versicolor]|uniref:hypothetical protein n=1 Tax=Reichenbachiella versicolor TaxID=1821036 RepID=UPI000D6DC84B|nr:hypothetical protein [Reichenbachiella versicolor]
MSLYSKMWAQALGTKNAAPGGYSKKEAVLAVYIYLSAFIGGNIILLFGYIRYFTGFSVNEALGDLQSTTKNIIIVAITIGSTTVLNYFYLIKNDRYLKIMDDFHYKDYVSGPKSFREVIERLGLVIFVIVSTLISAFVTGWLGKKAPLFDLFP